MKSNFINSTFTEAHGVEFVSESPNDGEIIFKGNSSTQEDVDAAVSAAKNASENWANLSLEERTPYLKRFIRNVEARKEELSKTISMEIGKPKWEADAEVASVTGKLEPSIDAYKTRCCDIIKHSNNYKGVTRFRPLGVTGIIGPYNYPMHMSNGHILPSLIAGNTVVLKPSEKAPLCAQKIIECWAEACLPTGTINMIHGDAVTVKNLVENEYVNGVFFTGSSVAGEAIGKIASTNQMLALEMGGDNPIIAWDASNIESAVNTIIQSAFITAGQRCICARRLILPDNEFADELVAKLVKTTKNITIGKYDDEKTPFYGPLRTSDMVDNSLALQEQMLKHGGIILSKAERLPVGKNFISPAIIDITGTDIKSNNEIFFPFITIKRINTFDEALREANNTEYGLSASLLSENRNLYEKYINKIKAGIVNWNKPTSGSSIWAAFGGIKRSGNFRPSGYLATDAFSYSVASTESDNLGDVPLPTGIK